MDETAALLSLIDRMLWVTALAAAPVLLACLAVGLVGIIQAATSVNEQTLTFVPAGSWRWCWSCWGIDVRAGGRFHA